jgi:hypothetical protein
MGAIAWTEGREWESADADIAEKLNLLAGPHSDAGFQYIPDIVRFMLNTLQEKERKNITQISIEPGPPGDPKVIY